MSWRECMVFALLLFYFFLKTFCTFFIKISRTNKFVFLASRFASSFARTRKFNGTYQKWQIISRGSVRNGRGSGSLAFLFVRSATISRVVPRNGNDFRRVFLSRFLPVCVNQPYRRATFSTVCRYCYTSTFSDANTYLIDWKIYEIHESVKIISPVIQCPDFSKDRLNNGKLTNL